MHQPVQDHLEEHLKAYASNFERAVPPEMQAHLASCPECADELRRLEQHAVLLRSLRAEGVEPKAGFYARVMQRIDDARAKASIWSVFLEPVFSRRLVFASVALVVLLGTYLISTEPSGRDTAVVAPQIAITQPQTETAPGAEFVDGTPQQERDAVLVSLASYQE